MSTPKPMNKRGLYAPATPSSNAAVPSHAPRKHSLRPTETGMAVVNCDNGFVLTYLYHTVPIYDGRKSRLRVPEDLSKIPDVLPVMRKKFLKTVWPWLPTRFPLTLAKEPVRIKTRSIFISTTQYYCPQRRLIMLLATKRGMPLMSSRW